MFRQPTIRPGLSTTNEPAQKQNLAIAFAARVHIAEMWIETKTKNKTCNFEYGYPHFNALLQFRLKLERCKPHNAACHPTKCDVINDVKIFPAVYLRISCRKL